MRSVLPSRDPIAHHAWAGNTKLNPASARHTKQNMPFGYNQLDVSSEHIELNVSSRPINVSVPAGPGFSCSIQFTLWGWEGLPSLACKSYQVPRFYHGEHGVAEWGDCTLNGVSGTRTQRAQP